MTAMDGDPKSDIFRQQSEFVKSLEKMAQRYDVAIVLVAHPKKYSADFDNDMVSGSSDITNAVSFVLNYQRANEEDDFDSLLSLTKNRINGKLLRGDNAIKLYYSDKSKRITVSPNETTVYGCFGEKTESEDWVL